MHHGKNKGEDFYSLFFRNLGGREDKFIVAVISSANFYHFYRAMHFSAKRGIAIACRLSVRLSVCLSVCL